MSNTRVHGTQSLPAVARYACPAQAGRLVPCLRTHGARTSQAKVLCRAKEKDLSFDKVRYFEATVEPVTTHQQGSAVHLNIRCEGEDLVIPIFIGEHERISLESALRQQPRDGMSDRPDTYGLMKEALLATGWKIELTRITNLRGHTFMARMHLGRTDGHEEAKDVDARPSDAINMAVRFKAPVYVSQKVVHDMAVPKSKLRKPAAAAVDVPAQGRTNLKEQDRKVHDACVEQMDRYRDPRLMLEIKLGMLVAQERYDEAARLRDRMESEMQQDLSLKLVISIKSALEDARFEEAEEMCLELKARLDAAERTFVPIDKSKLDEAEETAA